MCPVENTLDLPAAPKALPEVRESRTSERPDDYEYRGAHFSEDAQAVLACSDAGKAQGPGSAL